MEEQLLRAKLALIKMIHQFMYETQIDGEQYYHTCCESAGESAFNVLGIEEDIISFKELDILEEKLTGELWKIALPNEEYGGFESKGILERYGEECE